MYLTNKQLDDLANRMYKKGWTMFRIEQPWGQQPSFRNQKTGVIKYYSGGKLITSKMMKTKLQKTWRPVGRSGEDTYIKVMQQL